MFNNSFARAQAAYDAMLPPEYDEPDYAENCEDGLCGECELCAKAAKEAFDEDRAEAMYQRIKEGLDD